MTGDSGGFARLVRPRTTALTNGESGRIEAGLVGDSQQNMRESVLISGTKIMFTGLIEEVGSVLRSHATAQRARLLIAAPRISEEVQIGDSIAVNGCCLTVADCRNGELTFDLLEETLDRTNLRTLHQGSRLNLERALSANGRFGGHLVQGHVDCAAPILAWEKNGSDHRLEVELPTEFAHYVAGKGSIAVNGISLTIAEMAEKSFAVWIIPHTWSHTNLDTARAGELVNLEFDLIAKYLERMLGHHVAPSG